jgi:phosphoribosyl-AMP cyclohydrolase
LPVFRGSGHNGKQDGEANAVSGGLRQRRMPPGSKPDSEFRLLMCVFVCVPGAKFDLGTRSEQNNRGICIVLFEIVIKRESGKQVLPLDEERLRTRADLAAYFGKSDLIPAVVQRNGTGEVLMLAYMNEESLAKTLETGYTWFYSRSRGALWNKGETSGHFQRVVSVTPDCDDDALLVVVEQTGPACHTGNQSCFYRTGLLYGKTEEDHE